VDKLGFTFYPQDWWSSDSFYDYSPFERYVYLECIFIMYRNGGFMKTQKTQIENRLRIPIDDATWNKVTEKFIKTDDGFTSLTVNKRLKKASVSRENGKNGGRPPKSETQKTQGDNLKRKRKGNEREIIGRGNKTIIVKAVYATDTIKEIHDLQVYFESTNQLQSFLEAGWIHFDAFMDENPGRVFDDADHVYNTFRLFSTRYKPPNAGPDPYKDAQWDKDAMTPEAWEDLYSYKLKHDGEFRKRFGYVEPPNGKAVGKLNTG